MCEHLGRTFFPLQKGLLIYEKLLVILILVRLSIDSTGRIGPCKVELKRLVFFGLVTHQLPRWLLSSIAAVKC